MDSPTDFEDDEHFFGSYDAQHAASSAQLELEAADAQPPTQEQLAHRGRFKRPVSVIITGMAVFSLVALAMPASERVAETHGARHARVARQHAAERELVAHYGAAVAAPDPAADDAAGTQIFAMTVESSADNADNAAAPAFASEPCSALELAAPDTVSAFVSALASMCVRTVRRDDRVVDQSERCAGTTDAL